MTEVSGAIRIVNFAPRGVDSDILLRRFEGGDVIDAINHQELIIGQRDNVIQIS